MDKKEQAVALHLEGYNCSQAVVGAFCKELGLEKDMAMKVASGFGGGMQCGEMCGAVTGGLMALGLKYGQVQGSDQETKKKMYEQTKHLIKQFEATHGTTACKVLLGCDMGTDEGKQYAKEHNLGRVKCDRYIAEAVETVEKML